MFASRVEKTASSDVRQSLGVPARSAQPAVEPTGHQDSGTPAIARPLNWSIANVSMLPGEESAAFPFPAHEPIRAMQQGGQPQLIQRAPANYGSSAPAGPQQQSPSAKQATQTTSNLTADDWIWILASLRRSWTPDEFATYLGKNEGQFYPILQRYGFEGSKVKNQDELNDFDAAVVKWGKLADYDRKYGSVGKAAEPPKPKSREERKYEQAQLLASNYERHSPQTRGQINDDLESAGLMDDLVGLPIHVDGKDRVFDRESRWSHVDPYFYGQWAAEALRVYVRRYQVEHNIQVQHIGTVSTTDELDERNAQGEGLETMEGSMLGSIAGGIAMHLSDDPRVIAAAAGLGAAIEGSVGAVATAIGGKGSYRPDVENKPAEAYTNNRDRISDPVDPTKVGDAPERDRIPTPDAHPDTAKAADPYEKLSVPELKKLAKTDREAALALWQRYEEMPNSELDELVDEGDTAAKYIRGKRKENTPVKNLPKRGEARFSDKEVYDQLEQGIQASREASGIKRSGPHVEKPDEQVEGGAVGAAKTDVPGLEDRVFVAGSPLAGGKVNPDSKFKPATNYKTLPQTHGHAEQGLADQIDAAFQGIPAETLKGKTVWMLIEQAPCSTCSAGTQTSDPSVEAGVLAKLSKAYPMVKFEVKHMDGSGNKLTLEQGKDTVVPLRKPAKPKPPGGASQP